MDEQDISLALQQQVLDAFQNKTPLAITGGGSKSFLGRTAVHAQPIDISKHRGIVEYDPCELVLTARAIDLRDSTNRHPTNKNQKTLLNV